MSSSDDEYFTTSNPSSNLANIFKGLNNAPNNQDYNAVLTFNAPKQPKPNKTTDGSDPSLEKLISSIGTRNLDALTPTLAIKEILQSDASIPKTPSIDQIKPEAILQSPSSSKEVKSNNNVSEPVPQDNVEQENKMPKLPDEIECSNVLFAKPVSLYKYCENQYEYKGKLGMVILDGDHLSIGMYTAEGKIYITLEITSDMKFIIKQKKVVTLFSDEEYNLKFNSVEDCIDCAVVLELGGVVVTNKLRHQKSWSIKMKNKLTEEYSMIKAPGDDTMKALLEESIKRYIKRFKMSSLRREKNVTFLSLQLSQFVRLAFKDADLTSINDIKVEDRTWCGRHNGLSCSSVEADVRSYNSDSSPKTSKQSEVYNQARSYKNDNSTEIQLLKQIEEQLHIQHLNNQEKLNETKASVDLLVNKVTYAVDELLIDASQPKELITHDMLLYKMSFLEDQLVNLNKSMSEMKIHNNPKLCEGNCPLPNDKLRAEKEKTIATLRKENKTLTEQVTSFSNEFSIKEKQYLKKIDELNDAVKEQQLKMEPLLQFFNKHQDLKHKTIETNNSVTTLENQVKFYKAYFDKTEQRKNENNGKIKMFRNILKRLMDRMYHEISEKIQEKVSSDASEHLQGVIADNIRMCTFNVIDYLQKISMLDDDQNENNLTKESIDEEYICSLDDSSFNTSKSDTSVLN